MAILPPIARGGDRIPLRTVALIGASLAVLAPSVAVACPPEPATRPGWTVGVYPLRDRTVVRCEGLFRPTPLDRGVVTSLPRKHAGLPGMGIGSNPGNLVFEAQFRACQAGRYTFMLVVESGSAFGDPGEWGASACWGDMRQDNNHLFSITQGSDMPYHFAGDAVTQRWSGSVTLTEGVHPLRLRLACGVAQSAAGLRTHIRKSLDIGFDIRVAGPGDSAPRAFRPGEIFQID